MDLMWHGCSTALHKQENIEQLLTSHCLTTNTLSPTNACICLWHAPLATKRFCPATGNSDLNEPAK
eukprot:3552879-Heterocapsa_arctica.AAC.1